MNTSSDNPLETSTNTTTTITTPTTNEKLVTSNISNTTPPSPILQSNSDSNILKSINPEKKNSATESIIDVDNFITTPSIEIPQKFKDNNILKLYLLEKYNTLDSMADFCVKLLTLSTETSAISDIYKNQYINMFQYIKFNNSLSQQTFTQSSFAEKSLSQPLSFPPSYHHIDPNLNNSDVSLFSGTDDSLLSQTNLLSTPLASASASSSTSIPSIPFTPSTTPQRKNRRKRGLKGVRNNPWSGKDTSFSPPKPRKPSSSKDDKKNRKRFKEPEEEEYSSEEEEEEKEEEEQGQRKDVKKSKQDEDSLQLGCDKGGLIHGNEEEEEENNQKLNITKPPTKSLNADIKEKLLSKSSESSLADIVSQKDTPNPIASSSTSNNALEIKLEDNQIDIPPKYNVNPYVVTGYNETKPNYINMLKDCKNLLTLSNPEIILLAGKADVSFNKVFTEEFINSLLTMELFNPNPIPSNKQILGHIAYNHITIMVRLCEQWKKYSIGLRQYIDKSIEIYTCLLANLRDESNINKINKIKYADIAIRTFIMMAFYELFVKPEMKRLLESKGFINFNWLTITGVLIDLGESEENVLKSQQYFNYFKKIKQYYLQYIYLKLESNLNFYYENILRAQSIIVYCRDQMLKEKWDEIIIKQSIEPFETDLAKKLPTDVPKFIEDLINYANQQNWTNTKQVMEDTWKKTISPMINLHNAPPGVVEFGVKEDYDLLSRQLNFIPDSSNSSYVEIPNDYYYAFTENENDDPCLELWKTVEKFKSIKEQSVQFLKTVCEGAFSTNTFGQICLNDNQCNKKTGFAKVTEVIKNIKKSTFYKNLAAIYSFRLLNIYEDFYLGKTANTVKELDDLQEIRNKYGNVRDYLQGIFGKTYKTLQKYNYIGYILSLAPVLVEDDFSYRLIAKEKIITGFAQTLQRHNYKAIYSIQDIISNINLLYKIGKSGTKVSIKQKNSNVVIVGIIKGYFIDDFEEKPLEIWVNIEVEERYEENSVWKVRFVPQQFNVSSLEDLVTKL